MKTEEIKRLIEKYYEGETSLEEEKTLREYFSNKKNKQTDPEFAELISMFSEYESLNMEEEIPIPREPKVRKINSVPWYYSAAAAIVLLMVGFFIGDKMNNSDQQISELNNEIQQIKSMMSYNKVAYLTPSERIQVTYEVREMDSIDLETMTILIDLMQFDENTNVRLSATEALIKFNQNDLVRESFLRALKKETDPVIQVKLIDAIVKSKEASAIPELQKIVDSEEQNPAVQQRAAYGITQLI